MPIFSKVKGRTFDGNFVERVMRCSVFVIVAIQSLFFALGGIRDNLFNGRVVMPDEEYLQSWFYDTKLGESETHSDRMDTIGKCWGTFIATIALLKMATALSGGTQRLGKTLAVIFIATNIYTCVVFLPMDKLMEDHWTKNKPYANKGSVVPFMALFAVETVCWFLTTLAGCATLGGRQGSMKFA